MAQIESSNHEELRLDMDMGITIGPIRKSKDGKDVLSYKFIPVS
jgi:hypothetical protein